MLTFLLLATGCRVETAAPTTPRIVVIDGFGRPVALALPARRIVSVAPSNTELLFAVGAGERLIACDSFSDFPEAAKALPRVGTAGGRLDEERIVAFGPDLVLGAEINSPESMGSLAKLGLPVFRVSNPTTFDGLYENLALFGRLTDRETAAAELVAQLKARVEAVDVRLRDLDRRPLVFYELDATDVTKPWTAGRGTFLDLLIQRAGGENFGAAFDGSYPRVSAEQVLVRNPEFIVLGDAKLGMTAAQVAQRAGWSGLQAVTGGRVIPFDDNLASRPGPRLVDALEQFSRLFHPERWPAEAKR